MSKKTAINKKIETTTLTSDEDLRLSSKIDSSLLNGYDLNPKEINFMKSMDKEFRTRIKPIYSTKRITWLRNILGRSEIDRERKKYG